MRKNLLSNFVFLEMSFEKYHYTDNRVGVPLNYLAYMLSGSAKITSDVETIHITEGDIFFIPRNLGYQSYWYGDDEIKFLSCGFSSLNTGEEMNLKLQAVSCDEETKREIESIFSNGGKDDCESLAHFYSAMSRILPELKCKNESKEKLLADKIKVCIERNPHLSLGEIAKEAAVSEAYMYAFFKTATGTTPNDYRQKVLCEEAVKLLLTTDKKVEEIAEITNFSSSSYFRKVLRKHTGSTPKEIRRNRGF